MQHISLSPLTLSSNPAWLAQGNMGLQCQRGKHSSIRQRLVPKCLFIAELCKLLPILQLRLAFFCLRLNIFQLLLYFQANSAFFSPGLGIWPPAHSPLLTMSFDIISLSLGLSCILLHNVHNFTLTLLLHLLTDFTWRSVLWHSDLPLPLSSPRKGARWTRTCNKKCFWTLLQCLTSSPSSPS